MPLLDGDLVLGAGETPLPLNPDGTDMIGPTERLSHVAELLPEICTLDCGTMNFALGDYVMTNTPSTLRAMAKQVQGLGVRPELEVFDTGHLLFVKQLIKEGLIDDPCLIQLCMGIAYGVPADTAHLLAMVNALPENCNWGSFAISRMQMPWVAQSILLGGNVRVGLEDNLYLSKGVYASNAQLVEKARGIIEAMGARILTPAQARDRLKL